MGIKLVNVSYKDIFKNLNLSIKENGVYSVIAPSGKGESSLFNLIYGLDKNFTGEIYIGKSKITNKGKNDLKSIRKNISYLTQDYDSELFNINILEDIKYGLSNFNVNKMYEFLKTFGLDDKILKKSYLELSSGEKKKILLVKIFMSEAKILLLDDVISGLDYKSTETLIKLLKREKKNRIILISSMDSNFLLSSSDNFIILKNGTIFSNKYEVLSNLNLLNEAGLDMPNILLFKDKVLNKKDIKLVNRDNINDLIKDIYRNVSR